MNKRIYLNAVTISGPTASPGLWAHPEDRSYEYTSLKYWVELAQTLERGKFDAIFFADMLGVYDVYQGNMDTAIRQAIQVPLNDPSYLIPAMAAATKHLGFAATFSTTYEHPYALARKLSTLDHLTKGRVGWNIVTSNLDSAAKNYGLEEQLGLIERYDRGDEYMDVVYKLWEASWEEDAVVQDKERRIYTDPSKVHDIHHQGTFFQVPGIHLSEPSPQRTPMLFQAGNSTRGREFAAKHAECIFLNTPTIEATRFIVQDIRERAEKQGRDPAKVLFFPKLTPIVGRTETEAQSRYESFLQYSSTEGIFALLGAWSGIDFSKLGDDKLLEFVEKRDNRGIIETWKRSDPDKKWSAEELANFFAFGTSSLTIGSPEQIADTIEDFITQTGVDGFNIGHIIQPGTINAFVDLVVPELQRRGLVQREYGEGTYREKIFGEGPYLRDDHPGRQLAEAVGTKR
ncbi:LLM class flavin-dependent oxidoreductase [Paenibacillus sp. WQ 127069]|uniref:LLM class flavin-dependent oxidoreductase n=1 Tax=Paenibacillus baimaensis TaxID=2982185 RepID=A0ABT2USB6_9BACL|nr:LLM class flavin-dependent oxidoreductase [Paenibacillus sp. WQ 127069]MCU6797566.1 LLM class flavin-dependent oxidoreductase [Paenibacillus sp. WQ 127069]